jgi:hypothetical protein
VKNQGHEVQPAEPDGCGHACATRVGTSLVAAGCMARSSLDYPCAHVAAARRSVHGRLVDLRLDFLIAQTGEAIAARLSGTRPKSA